jgi:hypothetical protein
MPEICTLRRLLVTASVVPGSSFLVTLMKEALISSETSIVTRATRRNIRKDVIFRYRNWMQVLWPDSIHFRKKKFFPSARSRVSSGSHGASCSMTLDFLHRKSWVPPEVHEGGGRGAFHSTAPSAEIRNLASTSPVHAKTHPQDVQRN